MTKSSLLLNENPLLIMPELAVKIGLYESIILQQIHYWLLNHEKQQINYFDEHYWVYNSYPEWNKQFPFLSVMTIRRAFQHLEKLGLILSGNYNKLTLDRTKWYTIDYKQLESINTSDMFNLNTCTSSTRTDHPVNMNAPIPETTAETPTKTTNNRAVSGETGTVYKRNPMVVKAITAYRTNLFVQRSKTRHASLTNEQYDRVYNKLNDLVKEKGFEYDDLISLMCNFLNKRNIKTDFNILHFATDGILELCIYECGLAS